MRIMIIKKDDIIDTVEGYIQITGYDYGSSRFHCKIYHVTDNGDEILQDTDSLTKYDLKDYLKEYYGKNYDIIRYEEED